MLRYYIGVLLMIGSTVLLAQNARITGRVFDELTNEAIPFANVLIQGTTTGVSTDLDGKFVLDELEPGIYNLEVSYLGYQNKVLTEVQASSVRPTDLSIGLQESQLSTDEVEITAEAFAKPAESPLSLRSIGTTEIERFPGANRDISRVVLALPGVTTTVAYRNDLIIRGGNPNENRFYLDGIEVPNINHFATQGASGGSNGLINVDFIENVDFYSGAFPANRGNALSSVFEFKFKEGRSDRFSSRITVGATEAGVSLEGPLSKSKKATFIASARQSYQQLLFIAFGLPFLPSYTDAQFKINYKINDKNDLTILGLGAWDDLNLNLNANEEDNQLYLLNQLPYINQWSLTLGARYRHFTNNGVMTLVVSRNQVNNAIEKFRNNQNDIPDSLLFRLNSDEIENKFRAEHTFRSAGFKFNYGLNYELAQYDNQSFNNIPTQFGIIPINYNADMILHKYGLFGQISRSLLEERLSLSFGFRLDGTDYNSSTSNPFRQFSPRFSASYALTKSWTINGNIGRYFQLPAYTTLGFETFSGEAVNRDNGVGYISSNHFVLGTAYTLPSNTQFSVEGFYKMYNDYPFLLNDSIPSANVGGDFGVFGDQPASSSAEGRSYGLEFLAQQKYYKGWYGIVSYTIFRSEFRDKTGVYRRSSWDVGHVLNLTGGKKMKKNWDISFRFSIAGGSPFTPYDLERSSLISVWDLNGEGVLDYNNLNSQTTLVNQQLDIRVDKKWFFKKWNLNLYLDIRNLYAAPSNARPYVDVIRDDNGNALIDPNDPSRYQIRRVNNSDALVLPSIGIVVEL